MALLYTTAKGKGWPIKCLTRHAHYGECALGDFLYVPICITVRFSITLSRLFPYHVHAMICVLKENRKDYVLQGMH